MAASKSALNDRVALVIGNSRYSSNPLRNPGNDARIVGESLNTIGFKTTVKEDLTLQEMKIAIQDFARQLSRGGVGLFYYAGHGAQVDNRNFLMPIDFAFNENDFTRQMIGVDTVIQAVSGKSSLNIIIFDACRNTPQGFSMPAQTKEGYAEMRNIPLGTYVAFSASIDKTAEDGQGSNSPYSKALADNLKLSPARLEDVFIRTRLQVDNLTNGNQLPVDFSYLKTQFYFTENKIPSVQEISSPKVDFQLGADSFIVPVLDKYSRQIQVLKKNAPFFVESGLNLPMVSISGGSYLMGTDAQMAAAAFDDALRYNDQLSKETIAAEMPQHSVGISGFFMSRYEISQGQWRSVMGNLPNIPAEMRRDDFPVINISWRQANDFCAKLSRMTGKNYRLPTEAEWEYAAKANSQTPFAFGQTINSDLANFMGTIPFLEGTKSVFREGLVSVGQLKAFNAFGLADMHGNVWEWCADNWHDDYSDAPNDGSSWELADDDNQQFRIIRGGAWDSGANSCRSSFRRKQPQMYGTTKIGFRVVYQ